jgi:hypothetical protein
MNTEIEKKITPELEAKLNKIRGLSQTHEFLYVPKVYRLAGEGVIPKSEWPIFKLKGKNGLEIAEAEDNAGYMEAETTHVVLTGGKARIATLGKHILGWSNFKDRDGVEIKFHAEGGVVYKTSMQRLSAELQRELQEAINEQSVLTEEELQGLEY